MNRSSPKFVDLLKLHHRRFVRTSFALIAVVASLVPGTSSAQTPHHSPSPQKPASQPTELDSRIAAASAARDSGDPSATQRANELLIATALRELARLRM